MLGSAARRSASVGVVRTLVARSSSIAVMCRPPRIGLRSVSTLAPASRVLTRLASMTDAAPTPPEYTYSYLGPAGTFTEAALKQVPEAAGRHWRSVNNVGEALADVTSGRSTAAMIAIENSVEGGVSATQDALATVPGLRIIGEYLVPVNFVLVARPGTVLADVHIVNAHPVAYAQSRGWLERELPDHAHFPATSNVQAAASLFDGSQADAAVAPPGITAHLALAGRARATGHTPTALPRFVLGSPPPIPAEPTGPEKTSLIVELPDDEPGSLL